MPTVHRKDADLYSSRKAPRSLSDTEGATRLGRKALARISASMSRPDQKKPGARSGEETVAGASKKKASLSSMAAVRPLKRPKGDGAAAGAKAGKAAPNGKAQGAAAPAALARAPKDGNPKNAIKSSGKGASKAPKGSAKKGPKENAAIVKGPKASPGKRPRDAPEGESLGADVEGAHGEGARAGPKGEAHRGGGAKGGALDRKQRKALAEDRKKARKPHYDMEKKLTLLWEKSRQRNLEPEKRAKLITEMLQLMDGKMLAMARSHTASRVLQMCVKHGTAAERAKVFAELRPHCLEMAQNVYAHHLVNRMLDTATKEHKAQILAQFRGKVVALLRHPVASAVIDHLYHEVSGAQRSQLASEFFSGEFRLFPTSAPTLPGQGRLAEYLQTLNAQKRASVIEHLALALQPILEKGIVDHAIVHRVTLDYLMNSGPRAVRDTVEQLSGPLVLRMAHTRDGARVAAACAAAGGAKERKKIVKSLKGHVAKLALDENGHLLLLRLLDVMDDTKLLGKTLVPELVKGLKDLVQDKNGRRVLLHLAHPRCARYLPADVIAALDPFGALNKNCSPEAVAALRQRLEEEAAQRRAEGEGEDGAGVGGGAEKEGNGVHGEGEEDGEEEEGTGLGSEDEDEELGEFEVAGDSEEEEEMHEAEEEDEEEREEDEEGEERVPEETANSTKKRGAADKAGKSGKADKGGKEEEDGEEEGEGGAGGDGLSLGVSKKDSAVRRKELFIDSGLAKALAEVCAQHAGALVRSQWGSDVIYEVARGAQGGVLWVHLRPEVEAVQQALAEEAAKERVEGEGEGGKGGERSKKGSTGKKEGKGEKGGGKEGKEGEKGTAEEGTGAREGQEGVEAAAAEAVVQHVFEDFFASRTYKRLLQGTSGAGAPAEAEKGANAGAEAEGGGGTTSAGSEAEAEEHFAALLWKHALKGRCNVWGKGHSAKVVAAAVNSCHAPTRKAALKETDSLLKLKEFEALKRLVQSPKH